MSKSLDQHRELAMALFADDKSIFLIVDNAIESADILNRDLNTITSWSNK